MEYLKLFTQHSDYKEFINGGGGVSLPNVSYCEDKNEVHYEPYVEPTQSNDEIWYTSADGKKVTPYSNSAIDNFLDIDGKGISIISNTYENGKGIIKLGKNCYQFGMSAFKNCIALKSITIPNSLTTIGKYVFSGCTSLTDITIPDGVTAIGDHAFNHCTSLVRITIPNSVTNIGNSAFDYCSSLTGITIPDSVTTIGSGAFAGWTGATSTDIIYFPNEQLKIKYFESDNAFSNWKSLTSVAIPDSVTSIGYSAFSYCSSLSNITIPDGVTAIGNSAFYGCSKLSSITVLPETPPTLEGTAFSKIASNVVIYVPSGSVETYKSTDGWWSYFADKIQAIPE